MFISVFVIFSIILILIKALILYKNMNKVIFKFKKSRKKLKKVLDFLKIFIIL